MAQFSTDFHADYGRGAKIPTFSSFDRLDAFVQGRLRGGRSIDSVSAIVKSSAAATEQLDNPAVLGLLELLLKYGELNTASQLFHHLKDDGNKTMVANASYLLAEFHFQREQWLLVIEYLEGTASHLPQERYHHGLLMHGIALQKLKQHRAAISLYEKLPKSSKHYTAARMNIAIAEIRQDWWTDAITTVRGLLDDNRSAQQDVITDRLNTTLGYIELQQQLYRNARESFRHVGLDGLYTNQALLGLTLTAARQEDYFGALSAALKLKSSKGLDLAGAEAYILAPYLYERLGQHAVATAGYDEAIQYYANKITYYNTLRAFDAPSFGRTFTFIDDHTVGIDGQTIDLGDNLPSAFFTEYMMLSQLREAVANFASPRVTSAYNTLTADYKGVLHDVTQDVLATRIAQLTDYMNQSRYGIAKLYDDHDASSR